MKRNKKRGLKWLFSVLLGFCCALVLGALFYGAMVYQLSGEENVRAHGPSASPAPLEPGASAQALFPGQLLSLKGTLESEQVQDLEYGKEICRVVRRTYALPSGMKAQAISAVPATFFEYLAVQGYVPQLVTGYTLAGLDAVYERGEELSALAARSGECVYILEADIDGQGLYALGAQATLGQ